MQVFMMLSFSLTLSQAPFKLIATCGKLICHVHLLMQQL